MWPVLEFIASPYETCFVTVINDLVLVAYDIAEATNGLVESILSHEILDLNRDRPRPTPVLMISSETFRFECHEKGTFRK